jgi:hypothetical protein
MTLGSLTCGAEVDEDPDRSDTTLFPRENPVMTVGAQGYNGTSFPISLYIYICENVYYSHSKGQKKKGTQKRWGGQPEATGTAAGPSSVPRIGAGGLCFLQTL